MPNLGQEDSLGERLAEVRLAVDALRADPSDSKRTRLQRRLHVLGAVARTLRFPEIAQRIADVQSVLEAGGGAVAADVRAVEQLLAALPALEAAELPRIETTPDSLPVAVCVVGEAWIETLLHPEASEAPCMAFASCRFDDPAKVLDGIGAFAPDIFVLDVDAPGALELVSALVDDPRTELVPVVAIGDFRAPERVAQYVAMGVAHTFAKPVAAAPVRAACIEAVEQRRGRTIRMDLPAEMTVRPPEVEPAREALFVLAPVPASVPAEPAPPPDPRSLFGRRAIVADDDPVVVWFFADHLRKAGCVVEEALSGEAALARAFDPSASPPDLVVCDVVLRGTSGEALARALRADSATRDTIVVLASWKDELLDAARAKNVGSAYISKGVTPEALLAKTAELLGPQQRVRERIRTETVTGRIETVSVPRLVAMAASRDGASKITLRDGLFVHELFVQKGGLRRASRTAGERVEVGPRAAATAVGVVEGLYTIESFPDEPCPDQPCPDQPWTSAGPPELLADAIVAARAMRRAVAAERVPNIVDLQLDPDIAHVAAATNGRMHDLLGRLAGGTAPRLLVLQGEVTAAELARILADLAARGLVTSVREERADNAANHTVPLLLTTLRAPRPAAGTPAVAPAPKPLSVPLPLPLPVAAAAPLTVAVAVAVAPTPPAPPAPPVAAALPPAPPAVFSTRELSPPPLPAPPRVPETLSLPITFEPLHPAISIPIPGASRPRESDAPAAMSVSTPPAAPTPRPRARRTTAVLTVVALVGGIAIRWSVSTPPQRHAAAAADPASHASPTPASGVLEVSAADGTAVLVDGTERGRGPKLSVALGVGSHEVKTGGPEDKPRIVEIARGKVTHVDLSPKVSAAPK